MTRVGTVVKTWSFFMDLDDPTFELRRLEKWYRMNLRECSVRFRRGDRWCVLIIMWTYGCTSSCSVEHTTFRCWGLLPFKVRLHPLPLMSLLTTLYLSFFLSSRRETLYWTERLKSWYGLLLLLDPGDSLRSRRGTSPKWNRDVLPSTREIYCWSWGLKLGDIVLNSPTLVFYSIWYFCSTQKSRLEEFRITWNLNGPSNKFNHYDRGLYDPILFFIAYKNLVGLFVVISLWRKNSSLRDDSSEGLRKFNVAEILSSLRV